MLATVQTPDAVKLFSPTENLPAVLSTMSRELLSAHVENAKRVLERHQDVARNGDPEASHYYFFIPEVARDLSNARSTLAVTFAEIERRKQPIVMDLQTGKPFVETFRPLREEWNDPHERKMRELYAESEGRQIEMDEMEVPMN